MKRILYLSFATALMIAAIALYTQIREYGLHDFRIEAGTHDVVAPMPDLVLGLGKVTRPQGRDEPFYEPGAQIEAQRGLFSRSKENPEIALLFGFFVPFLFVILAACSTWLASKGE